MHVLYIWVQRFTRVSIYTYILYTDIGIIHVCVNLFIYYQYVYYLYVYVRVCVCVGVCVQIYFCMGLSLCTNILRANVSKGLGRLEHLGVLTFRHRQSPQSFQQLHPASSSACKSTG